MQVGAGRALNTAQAGQFKKAMEWLQAGQQTQALAIAEALAAQAPEAADAWQVLGMCLAANDRQPQANAAFERALALLPGNAMLLRNYGLALARHGKALRAKNALEDAEPVLRKALDLAPELAFAWVDLGVVLRRLGRIDEALAAFRQAEQLLERRGASALEVKDAINGTLADAGRVAEAVNGARQLVGLRPDHAPAHETLANLLWQHADQRAPEEDPLAIFRVQVQAQPNNRELQLAFVRMLLSTKRADEALALLGPLRLREPGDVLLDWFAADAFDALGEHEQARRLYENAARGGLGKVPEFLNAQARHAFRTHRHDLAMHCAEKTVALDPSNQEGWSHLGTAWRLFGDEREHWLFDYEHLVGVVEVESPPDFPGMPTFLETLATTLRALHDAQQEPLGQSVRGGTQTAGQLFGRENAVIRAAQGALHKTVETWLHTLQGDPTHPFLSRKRRSVRFADSWSVNLPSSGHHSNHIHPKGWASSAFYVALPGNMSDEEASSRAGWLQFGQPLEQLGLDLPPRRVIQPKPGHLALFPSYMWHGTVPFESQESRLTIAFDVQPKA